MDMATETEGTHYSETELPVGRVDLALVWLWVRLRTWPNGFPRPFRLPGDKQRPAKLKIHANWWNRTENVWLLSYVYNQPNSHTYIVLKLDKVLVAHKKNTALPDGDFGRDLIQLNSGKDSAVRCYIFWFIQVKRKVIVCYDRRVIRVVPMLQNYPAFCHSL